MSERHLKLKQPRYPDPVGTAGYFFVHAGHRETAIDHAIQVVRDDAACAISACGDDPIMTALTAPMGDWVVESLIQGAWLREYHEWEKATKRYFEGQHQRNGNPKPDWKGKLPRSTGAASHVDRVRLQLAEFGAAVSDEILDTLDAQRKLINSVKHEGEYLAAEQEYRTLVQAVAGFWNELASQEEFNI